MPWRVDFMYLKKFSRSVLLFLVSFSFFFCCCFFCIDKMWSKSCVCINNTAQQSWQNGRVMYEFCYWLKIKSIYKLRTLCGSCLHNELCNSLMTAWSEPNIFAWEWVFASLLFFLGGGGGAGFSTGSSSSTSKCFIHFGDFFPFHSTQAVGVFCQCFMTVHSKVILNKDKTKQKIDIFNKLYKLTHRTRLPDS